MISRTTDAPVPVGEYTPTADGRIVMYSLSWDNFETLLALRGERRFPKVAYLDGTVELMTPSRGHEETKSIVASLVEQYGLERAILLKGYGSWLIKQQVDEAGLEPDACYVFGSDPQAKDRPDLAIEVVWTSGGIEKLEIYRRLRVGEVWFWENDKLIVFVLGNQGYKLRERSACLPDLDLALICRLALLPTLNEAVDQLRAALR